jgi:endonuclease/exonuclease/phosphatase family metal-dependent hydrolase
VFVAERQEFQALMSQARPDVLLLDEVSPTADAGKLSTALAGLQHTKGQSWNIEFGTSGGRQRTVIASPEPMETVPEFSKEVPYPDADRQYLLEHMPARDRNNQLYSMDHGIPVNGAIILTGGRRLLAVIVDLQCCGNTPDSWQEFRRRVEAREIRRLVRQVLARTRVDGILIAGDFNIVNGAIPLILLSGPYPSHDTGLIAAELYHSDGSSTWTWDGRGMPFPSGVLDYQLYSPDSLEMRSGLIQDSEDLPASELELYGMTKGTSARTGRHRPLLAEYAWRSD